MSIQIVRPPNPFPRAQLPVKISWSGEKLHDQYLRYTADVQ